jgi:hypothetical protein
MNASKRFMDSTVGKTVGLMGGKERGCHWMLLVTSVILLTVGIYGTIVSSEYGCGNGLYFETKYVNNKDVPTKCSSGSYSNTTSLFKCINDNSNGHEKCMEGGMMTFSIISIIVGSLMLIMSMYMLFM